MTLYIERIFSRLFAKGTNIRLLNFSVRFTSNLHVGDMYMQPSHVAKLDGLKNSQRLKYFENTDFSAPWIVCTATLVQGKVLLSQYYTVVHLQGFVEKCTGVLCELQYVHLIQSSTPPFSLTLDFFSLLCMASGMLTLHIKLCSQKPALLCLPLHQLLAKENERPRQNQLRLARSLRIPSNHKTQQTITRRTIGQAKNRLLWSEGRGILPQRHLH